MMAKAIIVPDLAYISHQGRPGGRSNGRNELKAILKYLQYRDNPDTYIPHDNGIERWHDRGLGSGYADILERCGALSSDKVLAWTWVISPAPDLMLRLPESERVPMLIALTDRIVEDYYTARGMDVPEYAFVMHDRMTNAESGYPEPLHQLHTHVVLPGTVPTLEGDRTPFYCRASKGHVDLLRDVSTAHFSAELDRLADPEWRLLRREHDDEPQTEPLADLPPPAAGLGELARWLRGPKHDLDFG